MMTSQSLFVFKEDQRGGGGERKIAKHDLKTFFRNT